MSAISSATSASSYLLSILNSALQANNATASTTTPAAATATTQSPDSTQLSPFAQLMSALQKLQQTNPTEYKQVTQQIATNLASAAQTATADGNTGAATELTKLSTAFSTAAQTGQLPDINDPTQTATSGHHHHHSHGATASDSTSSSTTSAASQLLAQILASYQSTGSQTDSLNPLTIIQNTLSSAGVTG